MSTFSSELVEQVPVWANYLDVQNDVKGWLQIPPTDTSRDQQLQDLTDAACYWVQDYLGRPVGPTTFFRRFSGWANFTGAYLSLPYYPVLKVVNVTEWWGANGPNVLTQMIPENQGSQNVYQLDSLNGVLIRAFNGLVQRPFFPGSQNVEVEWVAGYNPIPPTIRLATRELIAYWWRNTQQASRTGPTPRSEYDMDPSEGSPLWPGIPNKVTTWLSTFVQQGIG